MFERIGYGTFGNSTDMTLMMMKSVTGFDFKRREIDSRKLYFEALGESFGARPPDTRSAPSGPNWTSSRLDKPDAERHLLLTGAARRGIAARKG
jgi:hypothetical protein